MKTVEMIVVKGECFACTVLLTILTIVPCTSRVVDHAMMSTSVV